MSQKSNQQSSIDQVNSLEVQAQLQQLLSQLADRIKLNSDIGPNLKWTIHFEQKESSQSTTAGYDYRVEFRDREKVLFDVMLNVDENGSVHIDGGLTDDSLLEAKPSFRLRRLFVSPEFNRYFTVRSGRALQSIYRLSSALHISQCSRASIKSYLQDVLEQINLFINVMLDDIPRQRLAL